MRKEFCFLLLKASFFKLSPYGSFPPKRVGCQGVKYIIPFLLLPSLFLNKLNSDLAIRNSAVICSRAKTPAPSLTSIKTSLKRKPLHCSIIGAFWTLCHSSYVFLEDWLKRPIVLGKDIKPIDWYLQWGVNKYLIFCWNQMLRICRDFWNLKILDDHLPRSF